MLTCLLAACLHLAVQGSAFYLSGAGLVIVGWTMIGLCIEAYGFWLLFCEFLPTVLQFSRRVPFMSKVLDMPFLKVVSSSGNTKGRGGCRRRTATSSQAVRVMVDGWQLWHHTVRAVLAAADGSAASSSLLTCCGCAASLLVLIQVINKISLMGGLPTSMEEANGRSR